MERDKKIDRQTDKEEERDREKRGIDQRDGDKERRKKGEISIY